MFGEARAGSGKTTVFSIGMLQNIDVRVNALQSLCIVPTHELAIQIIEDSIMLLADGMPGLRVLAGIPLQDLGVGSKVIMSQDGKRGVVTAVRTVGNDPRNPAQVFDVIFEDRTTRNNIVLDFYTNEYRLIEVSKDDFTFGRDSITGEVLKPHIIVGCAGTVKSWFQPKGRAPAIIGRTDHVRVLALDEADMMLEGGKDTRGFGDDMQFMLTVLPSDIQKLFFSATFPADDQLHKMSALAARQGGVSLGSNVEYTVDGKVSWSLGRVTKAGQQFQIAADGGVTHRNVAPNAIRFPIPKWIRYGKTDKLNQELGNVVQVCFV